MPLRSLHGEACLPKTNPTPHPSQIPVVLRHLPHLVDDPPRHQPKISGVQRQPNIGKLCHHSIKHKVTDSKGPGFLSPDALRIHDLVTLLVFLHKLRDHFWNVLQVPTHYHRSLPRYIIQRCCNRSLVPKITGKRYHLNSGILFYCLLEYHEGAVSAPIIYENNFVRAARYLIEHHAGSAQKLWQDLFFIVEWNGNRETEPSSSHGIVHHWRSVTPSP